MKVSAAALAAAVAAVAVDVATGACDTTRTSVTSAAQLKSVCSLGSGYTGVLPVEVTTMTSLTELSIPNGGFLGTLPDLGKLSKLKKLDLGGNAFEGLGSVTMKNLGALTHLDISENGMTSNLVKPQIKWYNKLKYLDVSGNNFDNFNKLWNQLTVLTHADLRENDYHLAPATETNEIDKFIAKFSFTTFYPQNDGLFPPTPKPTKKPTTGTPTRAPSPKPTKRPTTPIPTKRPTTGRPTRAPSPRPTKRPTTPIPTKRPTTGKPTRAPTPQPTRRPTPQPTPRPTKTGPPTLGVFSCPEPHELVKCSNINDLYPNRPEKRRHHLIRHKCQKAGCYYCGEKGDDSPAACRPMNAKDGLGLISRANACKDNAFPSNKCPLYDCPPPKEMTACETINDLPGTPFSRRRKRECERGFMYEGTKIEKRRCAFYKGICRAIGDYYKVRREVFKTEGLFKTVLSCPYES